MTIKSYILKKYKKHIDLIQSNSTNSLYITLYKEYTIRLSDHMPSETRHGVDMYITMMTNTRKFYTVAFYPTMQQRLMSYKEIVAYIDSLCLMYEIHKSDFAVATYRKHEQDMKMATQSARTILSKMKESTRIIKEAERIKNDYATITADFYLSLQKIRTGGLSANEFVKTDDVKNNRSLRSKSPIYELFLDETFIKDCPHFRLIGDDKWVANQLRGVFASDVSYLWLVWYFNDAYSKRGEHEWNKDYVNKIIYSAIPAWKKDVKEAKVKK